MTKSQKKKEANYRTTKTIDTCATCRYQIKFAPGINNCFKLEDKIDPSKTCDFHAVKEY